MRRRRSIRPRMLKSARAAVAARVLPRRGDRLRLTLASLRASLHAGATIPGQRGRILLFAALLILFWNTPVLGAWAALAWAVDLVLLAALLSAR